MAIRNRRKHDFQETHDQFVIVGEVYLKLLLHCPGVKRYQNIESQKQSGNVRIIEMKTCGYQEKEKDVRQRIKGKRVQRWKASGLQRRDGLNQIKRSALF